MWANRACTERPVVGESYDYLYVQFFKAYGFGDSVSFDYQLQLYTPSEGLPDDPYQVFLYIDWVSPEFDVPFAVGDIVECFNQYGYPVEPDWEFSFDPLT